MKRASVPLGFAVGLLVLVVPTASAETVAQTRTQAEEAAVTTSLVRARKVGTVTSAEVTSTTLGEAQMTIDPGAAPPPGMPPSSEVELVTAYGTFVDFMAKMPRGRAFPTGNKMAFIVERQSGLVVGTHLDGEAILTSKMARRHATAVMASHRPRAKAASWGKGCSQTHHCYATAEWLMHGGEMVEGTLDIEDTTSMNVPGWASGDFVDHEGWTIFEPAGYWVEAGNTAGEYFDCCGRHPFYAHKNAGGYGQYVAPGTVTGEPYYQMNSTGGNAWSTYWWGNLVNTEWGFSTYSNDLEVGLEVAANTKPATSASIADNATWTDGSVHNWNKAEWYHDSGTCIGPNAKAPAVGNVSVSTC